MVHLHISWSILLLVLMVMDRYLKGCGRCGGKRKGATSCWFICFFYLGEAPLLFCPTERYTYSSVARLEKWPRRHSEDRKKTTTRPQCLRDVNIDMSIHRAIWEGVNTIHMSSVVEDTWIYKWDPEGNYSSNSIYNAHSVTQLHVTQQRRSGVLGHHYDASLQPGYSLEAEFGQQACLQNVDCLITRVVCFAVQRNKILNIYWLCCGKHNLDQWPWVV